MAFYRPSRGGFYVDDESVRRTIASRTQLNIIHSASGLKVDVVIPKLDDFDLSRLSRARRVRPGPGYEASFASPEDVILEKLVFYREGGSEKHLRDIAGVAHVAPFEVVDDVFGDVGGVVGHPLQVAGHGGRAAAPA